MRVSRSVDVFQENISSLMETFEYVSVYLDDLLAIISKSLEDHLSKLREVLIWLKYANLKVDAAKSFFYMDEVEYLEYLLT